MEHGNWDCILHTSSPDDLGQVCHIRVGLPTLATLGFERFRCILQQNYIKVFRTANLLTGLHIFTFMMQYI